MIYIQFFLQVRVFNLLRKIKREKILCIHEGCAPTNEEIARRVGITTKKLTNVLWYGRDPISLNDQITCYGEDVTYQVFCLLK
jgi:DNA-directed RNA polymerase sigma subunit (sigma70/sigma32)